jgi:hypothetical protein
MSTHSSPTYDLEALIISAFKAAREKGKPEWRRMSIAVLKNRLIQMTHGEFGEARHGASSIRELLARYPQLVKIDDQMIELLGNHSAEESGGAVQRVRADLWRATMDYTSGTRYAWDQAAQRAREATEGDALIIPTLTKEEIQQWRDQFSGRDPSDVKVQRWRSEGLGTYALPLRLRHEWNRFVQAKVTERLSQWLKEHALQVPLTESVAQIQNETPTDRLRAVVVACVQVMTREELADLKIPATVVYRVQMSGRFHE